MPYDERRTEHLSSMMVANNYDALICHWPQHVLALTGYAPILGESAVIFLFSGDGTLIVPEAEAAFAHDSWLTGLETYKPSTLEYIQPPEICLEPILIRTCVEKGISHGKLGIEACSGIRPSAYPAMYSIDLNAQNKWGQMFPDACFTDATAILRAAASIKSAYEIEHISIACAFAGRGFEAAKSAIKPGICEIEVAAIAANKIEISGIRSSGVRRVGAWAFCMSGERSADAYLPFQYSTSRQLEVGDSVVVHINCHADGYWTDLTRTFFVGAPSKEQEDAYYSILQAWQAAFNTIRNGVRAADVDAAARNVLSDSGYGEAFLHGAGHGVGFQPIYHGDPPVLHPASDDKLRTGMVFNMEPLFIRDNDGESEYVMSSLSKATQAKHTPICEGIWNGRYVRSDRKAMTMQQLRSDYLCLTVPATSLATPHKVSA